MFPELSLRGIMSSPKISIYYLHPNTTNKSSSHGLLLGKVQYFDSSAKYMTCKQTDAKAG